MSSKLKKVKAVEEKTPPTNGDYQYDPAKCDAKCKEEWEW